MNIFEYLQYTVNEIAIERWSNDTCPPRFVVSLMYGDGEHKIILTCHHGDVRSVVLFPEKDIFSYKTLEEEMLGVYNSTI